MTMLHQEFDSTLNVVGKDFFKTKVPALLVDNLTMSAELREYQREGIGRLIYYLTEYPNKKKPFHLLFHMATGSGKTLIMAASILYLYEKGYRNFIFFVNSTNIIRKTKENFTNPSSSKYLFADKIKFGNEEVQIMEVDNFEAADPRGINILFTTIQGLHSRMNSPREDSITYEDFAEKKIVLLSDEGHHINTLTKLKKSDQRALFAEGGAPDIQGLKKEEEEELRSWEGTVMRILNANKDNILLEFTATIDLNHQAIAAKYADKIIFEYDLKQYRLDRFSKELEILEADLPRMDRALVAVILSQYRMKVAQKHKIPLKPIVMFKANRVNPPKKAQQEVVVSSEFKSAFLEKIQHLQVEDLKRLQAINHPILQKAFAFFKESKIAPASLLKELRNDFSEEKCISIDSKEQNEENQLLVNSLESQNNAIRAVFAVDALNEGWDVLNLFDIVRLYNTRDAKANKPGNYTIAEAQLVGRGARYWPFATNENSDKYRRKFDEDTANELRIIEQLHYHSAQNHRYIAEITSALKKTGIMPDRKVNREIKVKDAFKETALWRNGVLFLNEQVPDMREDVKSLETAEIVKEYAYNFTTGFVEEHEVLGTNLKLRSAPGNIATKKINLSEIGDNVIREALNRIEFYYFANLKQFFPNIDSVSDFINKKEYLNGVSVVVQGEKDRIEDLSQKEKLELALFVLEQLAKEAQNRKREYKGTYEFRAHKISEAFRDKLLQIDGDSPRAQEMEELNLSDRPWFAQNEIWGTKEEELFLKFFDEVAENLKQRYNQIAVLRNERHFKIFNFDDGQAFEPDFVMFLKERKTKKEVLYQIFVEPKGDQFLDEDGLFAKGRDGWKEKFLLQIVDKFKLNFNDFKVQNMEFKLIGLPFYNEGLKERFEESFHELVKA
ncbi:MAG: Type III site-specific deoxyribonuclease [Parcubacteria group bacterium GW2011_GWA2_53_21]|nr:MAG: Type III site-specific deoxyribonuclease [Parcubacteria group bacterium GW2011_GWA2_53_21]